MAVLITFALWSCPFVALAHQTLPQWYMDLQSLVQGPCQPAPVVSPFWNPVLQLWTIPKFTKHPQSFSEVAAENWHRHQTHAHSLPCFPGLSYPLLLQMLLCHHRVTYSHWFSLTTKCNLDAIDVTSMVGPLSTRMDRIFLLLILYHDQPTVTINWGVCVVSLTYWSRTHNCLPDLLECSDYRHESSNPAST